MIKFTKIRKVTAPTKNLQSDAGIDFFVPDKDNQFIKDLVEKNNIEINSFNDNGFFIQPHRDILIPSGIKSIIPKNYSLVAENKSGVATKQKLMVGASVIDEEYRGEIHIHLINTSNNIQHISFGQKIIQFIIQHVPKLKIEIISNKKYNEHNQTNRNDKGFGSSGI